MATGGGTIEMRQVKRSTKECSVCGKEADYKCMNCENMLINAAEREAA